MSNEVTKGPWTKYQRVGEIEARPWTTEEADALHKSNDKRGVSISEFDFGLAISHDAVGWLARNINNHTDQWYIAPEYFAKHYAAVPASAYDSLREERDGLREALDELLRTSEAAEYPCTNAEELAGVEQRLRAAKAKARAELAKEPK